MEKEFSKRIMLDLNSVRNEDVCTKISNRDKSKYPKYIDYICDAIRSFDENQSKNIDMKQVQNMVSFMIEERLKNSNISIIEKEDIITSLEDNIGSEINCDDD